MSYNMMIGYDIYDCFTTEHFRLNDPDDQNLLLATVHIFIIISSKKNLFKWLSACYCSR
jgi:hypothetical protein